MGINEHISRPIVWLGAQDERGIGCLLVHRPSNDRPSGHCSKAGASALSNARPAASTRRDRPALVQQVREAGQREAAVSQAGNDELQRAKGLVATEVEE